MFDDRIEFVEAEQRLINDQYSARCKDLNLSFLPESCDDYVVKMYGRVFDERRGNRMINFDLLSGSEPYIVGGFTKKMGFDYEIDLLSLSYDPNRFNSMNLWNIYFKWMHETASIKQADQMINQLMSNYNKDL